MTGEAQTYNLSSADKTSIRRRLVTNSGLLGGARALSAVMGLATLILAARTLNDQAAFGTLLFIHAYMLFFSEVASMQLWQAIIRFGADDITEDTPHRFGTLVKTSLILDGLSALAAFILAVSCFGFYLWTRSALGFEGQVVIGEGEQNVSLKTLVMSYCVLLLFRQINVPVGIFRLFDKFNILAARALIMPSIRLSGVIIAYFQGWGLTGLLAVWFTASLLSYLVLQIWTWAELSRRHLLPYIFKAKLARRKDIAGLYSFAVKCSLDSTLNSFKAYFPSLIIMVFLGPATVAVLRIAEEISRFLSRAVGMFDQVLLPELARLVSAKQIDALLKLTLKAAIYIGLISFAVSGIVMIWGEGLISKAFETGYDDVPLLATMLLFAASILSVSIPFYSMLYSLKRPGLAIILRVIGIVVFVIIFVVIFKTSGLFAVGWAALGSALIEVVFLIYLSYRSVKLNDG